MINYVQDRKQRFALDNIEIIQTALSDHRGTAQLTRQRIGDGSASLQLEWQTSNSELISVPLAPLDDFEVSNPRFIKCDVEGHEPSVFAGARRLIKTSRPAVQFESIEADASRPFSFFEALGYHGTTFVGNAYLPYQEAWRVPHPKFGLGGHRDFLFFPESAIGSTVPSALYRRFNASAPDGVKLRSRRNLAQ